VQQTDYYPYGLIARNFVRAGEKETLELFQGKTYDELTGWYDFHARQYDAALGRWFGVDPQDQFSSPYLAMGNNPVMGIDPDGEFVIPLIAAAVGGGLNLWSNIDKVKDFKTGLAYFGSGALGGLVSLGNPFAGGSLTSSLNIGIDIATGNLPEFNNAQDVLKYGGFKALEGLSAGQSGNLVKGIAKGLGNIGWIQYSNAAPGGITKIAASSYKMPEFTLGITKVPVAKIAASVSGKAFSLVDDAAKSSTTALTKFYPANNGFLGAAERTFLMPGQQISRYGSTTGKFFSPAGTPLSMRALPSGSNSILNTYKVLKPFEVQAGRIAAAFGQPGLGTQFLSPVRTSTLLKRGIIAPF